MAGNEIRAIVVEGGDEGRDHALHKWPWRMIPSASQRERMFQKPHQSRHQTVRAALRPLVMEALWPKR